MTGNEAVVFPFWVDMDTSSKPTEGMVVSNKINPAMIFMVKNTERMAGSEMR